MGQVAVLLGQASCQPRRQLRTRPEQPRLPGSAPRGAVYERDDPVAKTQGSVVLHLYRELAQHLGQMEVTRDAIVASAQ